MFDVIFYESENGGKHDENFECLFARTITGSRIC